MSIFAEANSIKILIIKQNPKIVLHVLSLNCSSKPSPINFCKKLIMCQYNVL